MKYRYLLADNDNTLMDFNRAEYLSLGETLRAFDLPDDEATCTAYHHINDALWKALERGETTQKQLKVDRFAQLMQHIGRPDVNAVELALCYADKLSTHAELIPGAMDFLEAVHGKLKIALVSNGVSAIQRGRLSRCAFTPLLDAVIISEEIGVSKPNPRMIDLALEALGCTDRSEAVLLGDSLSADIPAAVNAGIDSIYLSLHGKTSDQATYTVHSLEEAAALLLDE